MHNRFAALGRVGRSGRRSVARRVSGVPDEADVLRAVRCSLNLLLGYVGLLSFGHAAFFGGLPMSRAARCAIMACSPEVALLVGAGVGAALGFVFGLLAIRRKGIYFAMVTLALAQMIYFFCVQVPFTGGEDGMQGVPRGRLFGALSLDDDLTLYYVILALERVHSSSLAASSIRRSARSSTR